METMNSLQCAFCLPITVRPHELKFENISTSWNYQSAVAKNQWSIAISLLSSILCTDFENWPFVTTVYLPGHTMLIIRKVSQIQSFARLRRLPLFFQQRKLALSGIPFRFTHSKVRLARVGERLGGNNYVLRSRAWTTISAATSSW